MHEYEKCVMSKTLYLYLFMMIELIMLSVSIHSDQSITLRCTAIDDIDCVHSMMLPPLSSQSVKHLNSRRENSIQIELSVSQETGRLNMPIALNHANSFYLTN